MAYTLRPYQVEAINRWTNLAPPRRLLLAHVMGAGKTVTALYAAKAIDARKILIVVPASVRPMWARETAKVFSEVEIGAIENSLAREHGLSKEQKARRDAAYAAPIQICGYELATKLVHQAWDLIIFDEIHKLRSPLSKQAKYFKKLIKAFPSISILGLSGTPIPNEVKNLWNPLDTLWPNKFGRSTKTGDISWGFREKYCLSEVKEWQGGTAVHHYGLKEEMRVELRALLQPFMHEVSEAQVAPFMPEIFVEPLYNDADTELLAVAVSWVDEVSDDGKHIGIYTHHKELAFSIARALQAKNFENVFSITGNDTATQRDVSLQAAAACSSSIIVGTTHALEVGVDLSFQQQALIVEWQTAMDQVTQFLGRFRRANNNKIPSKVEIVIAPGDDSRVDTLRCRIEDKKALLEGTQIDALAGEVFRAREFSDDMKTMMFDNMFTGVNFNKTEWSNDDEEKE